MIFLFNSQISYIPDYLILPLILSQIWWLLLLPHKELRSERLVKTKWLSIKELPRFVIAITSIFDNKGLNPKDSSSIRKLIGLIIIMWKLSGITFTIKYWSEVLRLTICSLDLRNKYLKDNKTWVKTHNCRNLSLDNFHGMPCILPTKVKFRLVDIKKGISSGSLTRTDLVFVKLLLSVLSFFRATSPDFSETKTQTITGNFTGECLFLPRDEVTGALRSMNSKNLKFKSKPSLYFNSYKSGPNSTIAVLGIGLDLVAWIMRPKQYFTYCRFAYNRGYYFLLFVYVSYSVIILPLIPFFLLNFLWSNERPLLGRIAVLPEARGKRRLIGITDWWTQVLLRPLHDDIYSFLATLPQDGTNNQVGPIKALLKSLSVNCNVKTRGKRLQSLDLSAATDRLPVILQGQILNILGFDGDGWRRVLDREWYLQGKFVTYKVGQPMGAYSSFAMLALTHHVITRIASLRCKVNPSTLLYAILGDDIAMANKKVAKTYMEIFKSLGMEINPIKGFDGTVLEFAKQIWTINGYNLSPMGAKNILLFIRNVEFLPSIIYELVVKMFPFFLKGNKLLTFEGSGQNKRRNWKRTADSHTAIPIVTFQQFEFLIKSLFFNRNKNKKKETLDIFRNIKVRIRVLMAIGPRSGLWFIKRDLISHIFETKYMVRFFRELFITALQHWKFMSRGELMKYMRTKDEISLRQNIVRNLTKDLIGMYTLFLEFLVLPFTFLPIENLESARFSHFMNRTNWILMIFSPSILNLLFSLFKLLKKITYKTYLISRLSFLRILKNIAMRGFVIPLIFGSLLCLFITRDLLYLFIWVNISYALHSFITSDYFVREIIWSVHETTGFAWWQPYDPVEASVTTLNKVVDRVKLEDSGAYKQIISMLRGNRHIRDYLVRRNESENKVKGIKPNVVVKRKWKDPGSKRKGKREITTHPTIPKLRSKT